MSVNMFGLRFTTDAQARSKNGQPAQNTTGVASTSPSQLTSVSATPSSTPTPTMSAMVSDEDRRAERAAIQKRRVMSISSGLGWSVRDTIRGSSAMPQIGQRRAPP